MAPHGGFEETDSPLDSTKWHSLPSTIRELSKMWSPEEEMVKTGLSDLTNLSCTPQLKQTSTPLRKGMMDRKGGASNLVDFFKHHGKPRDIRESCDMNDKDVEESSELDMATKQKAVYVMDEIKFFQSQLKRRVMMQEEDVEQSMVGVMYHSPVIEVHKRRTCILDNMNHTLLQSSDECDSSRSPQQTMNHTKEQVEEEQLQHQVIDDSLKTFCRNLREKRLSPTKTDAPHEPEHGGVRPIKIPFELKSDIETSVDCKNKDVELEETDNSNKSKEQMIESSFSPGQPIDSFWDLTTQWSRIDKNGDGVIECPDNSNTQIRCEVGSDQRVEAGAELLEIQRDVDVTSHEVEAVSPEEIGGNGYCKEVVESGEKSQGKMGDEDDASRYATFSLSCSNDHKSGKDLNTTFTLDANVTDTEPDSWFHDTVPSVSPVSRHISSHVDDTRTKGAAIYNEAHQTDCINDKEETKILGDFEFQEYYIDDDLDTSESIQPVLSSESTQIIESAECSRNEEEDPHLQSPPPTIHSPQSSQNQKITNDSVVEESSKQADQSETKQGLDIKQNILLLHSTPPPDNQEKEQIGDVKDKIALFAGMLKEKSAVVTQSQELHSWTGKNDSFSYVQQKQELICSLNHVTREKSSGSLNGSKDGTENKSDDGVSGTVKKTRLIPKIKEEDIKFVKANLVSKQPHSSEVNKNGNVKDHSSECQTFENQMNCHDTMLKTFAFENQSSQTAIQLHEIKSLSEKEAEVHGNGYEDDKDDELDNQEKNNRDDIDCIQSQDDILSKESSSYSIYKRASDGMNVGRYDYDEDFDSDDWVSEKLHSVQERIRRRRQRDIYVISSEEEEQEDEESHRFSLTQTASPLSHPVWMESPGGDSYLPNVDYINDVDDDDFRYNKHCKCGDHSNYKMVSVSSSERLSLPQSLSRSSFSNLSSVNKRLPVIGDSNDCLCGMNEDVYQFQPSEDSRDGVNLTCRRDQGKESEDRSRSRDHHLYRVNRAFSSSQIERSNKKAIVKQRSNSQRIHSMSMDNVKGFDRDNAYLCQYQGDRKSLSDLAKLRTNNSASVQPIPRPRSIKNVRSNESRSSMRTVMFEDETDGLRQFSSNISQEFTANSAGVVQHCCASRETEDDNDDDDDEQNCDYCDATPEGSCTSKVGWNGYKVFEDTQCKSLTSHRQLNETFDVMEDEGVESVLRHGGEVAGTGSDTRNGVWEDESIRQRGKEAGDQGSPHCFTLGLNHDQEDTGVCSRDKICTIGDNVYTEVHRFYIPKSKWPDGCKTRFHVDLCPNNPRRHRISTTAIDPVSGRQEVLMEKTVDTDRLRSHLTID